jgi:hypothetical protein
MQVSGQHYSPAALTPAKAASTHFIGRLCGHQCWSGGFEKWSWCNISYLVIILVDVSGVSGWIISIFCPTSNVEYSRYFVRFFRGEYYRHPAGVLRWIILIRCRVLLGELSRYFDRCLTVYYQVGCLKLRVFNIFSYALPMKYLHNFTRTFVGEYSRHFVCRLWANFSPHFVKRLAVDFLDMLTDVTW